MELKGNIGATPVVYDVTVDALFNVELSIGYKDASPTGMEMGIQASVPLKAVLDALVAKANSPVLSTVETVFLMAVQSYLASLPAPKV